MVNMMLAYLATGILAGTMSGLLGIGGGVVVVPALAAIFLNTSDIPSYLYMKMAISTSLAIMIVTLASGVYIHSQRGAVNWKLFKLVTPGLVIGIALGASLVYYLSSTYLMTFFSLFLIIISFRLLKKPRVVPDDMIVKSFSRKFLFLVALVIGTLSCLLGAGGGTMWVPFFIYARLSMYDAIGTSVACGVLSAIVSTFYFIVISFMDDVHIPWSTGYIYWPAFVSVAIMSVLFAPLGAILAHRLSTHLLKRIFAVFLLLTAIAMMVFK